MKRTVEQDARRISAGLEWATLAGLALLAMLLGVVVLGFVGLLSLSGGGA